MSQPVEDDDMDLLVSDEKLDRASPELWPEQYPGLTEFLARSSIPVTSEAMPDWLKEFDQSDMTMLNNFGNLTPNALLDELKMMQNMTFQLQLEEDREITRGKYLEVLKTK